MMLRQLQSVLFALQVVQLVFANTMLPMELYEVAHSHQQQLQQSSSDNEAVASLHDLLVREEQFLERSHPMSQVLSADGTATEDQQPRRHRVKGGGGRRRNRMQQHRQGRQMVPIQAVRRPEIYYVVGVSKTQKNYINPGQHTCSTEPRCKNDLVVVSVVFFSP